MHDPNHSQKRINQLPQHSCSGTMQKQVVCDFLLTFAQITPIQKSPTPPFELAKSKNSTPRHFPSKETDFSGA